MHGHAIAHEIVDKARANGEPEAIEVEVGELANITARELEETLKQHADWKLKITERKARVRCACGFQGAPKIIAREHDLVLFACPKCKAAPEIVEGGAVLLKKVVLRKGPKVFAVGNPLFASDSVALNACKIAAKKSSAPFVFCENLDDLIARLMEDKGEKIVVDVAKGIAKPTLLDVSQLKAKAAVGAHDFDAGFFLRFAEAAGLARGVKIIALPEDITAEAAAEAVLRLVKK